jgi:hypothetical protein
MRRRSHCDRAGNGPPTTTGHGISVGWAIDGANRNDVTPPGSFWKTTPPTERKFSQ